ncbi:MAG: TonB-dependent receptor [Gemmatimonadota bacterium]
MIAATLLAASLSLPALTASTPAPDTVRGRVTDGTSTAVADARVVVTEFGRVVTTGPDGRFALPLPDGHYTAVVDHPGFAARRIVLDVPVSGLVEVELAAAPLQLDPLSVTAERAPSAASGSPLPITTLEPEALDRRRIRSLARAIDGLPGVDALTTGEQIGKPVVRGLSGARVLVLENGHPLRDYSWSDEDGPAIDPALEDRVEVIRGPASVLYGSDAIGGVVNALPAPLPYAGPSRTSVGLTLASNDREAGGSLRHEGASGAWAWRVAGVGRLGQDIHTPSGPIDNTGFFAAAGELALARHSERGTTTLRYSRQGGEYKLLEANGPPPGVEEADEGPERKSADDRIQLDGNYVLGGTRLETRAQWQRHWIAELSDDLSTPGQKIETEVFNLALNSFSGDVLLHHGGERVGGTVGVSLLREINDTRGAVPLVPDATTSSAALFAFEQASVGPIRLLAGVRAETHSIDADANADLALAAQTRSSDVVVGNVGAVLNLTGNLSVAANVGRAFRAPNLFELFTNGPRLGEARYEIGDPELTPETSVNLDGSVRWDSPRVHAELSGYHNRIDDFVFVAPTGEFRNGLRVFRYAQANAELDGGEALVRVRPTDLLTLEARFDAVEGRRVASDEPLPFIPPPHAAFEAELHPGHWTTAFTHPRIGVEVEAVAEKEDAAANELATGGHAVLNLDLGGELHLGARDFNVDLQVRNVTNAEYRSFLSRYKEFASDPGRSVVLLVGVGL